MCATLFFIIGSIVASISIVPSVFNMQNGYAQAFCGTSFLQEFCNSKTQQWVDPDNNIRIIFALSPTDPVAENVTKLKFSIENLKSGSLLKNLSASLVIVSNLTSTNTQNTSEENLSSISNIISPSGSFAINYEFLQYGKHQVILRVNSKNNFSVLASFYFEVSASQA
jgi:hypothetical protein